MSRKLNVSGSVSASNTLFNYFSKSPAVEKKKLPKTPSTEDSKSVAEKENVASGKGAAKAREKTTAKRKLEKELTKRSENGSEEEEVVFSQRGRKRRRIVVPQSDDDDEEEMEKDGFATDDDADEYKPTKDEEVSSEEETMSEVNASDLLEEHTQSEAGSSDSEHEVSQKRNNNNEPITKKKKLEVVVSGVTFQEKLRNITQEPQNTDADSKKNDEKFEKIVCSSSTLDEPVVWPHQKLEFLKPTKIKDKQGRRPDDPDYDPSTLFVPKSFLDGLSPGVRQWWVLKSDNYDCVLLFKVGKFYELYHMDADVGVSELGFTYMRGEFAHSGFPEISFDKMSTILVDRGYKIARVEQTETPDMMTERCKQIKATKFDKVVRREICQITNRGTQVFGTQSRVTLNHRPNYMLAVVEQDTGATSNYGICYIDTSIGDFFIGEFEDDRNSSRLLTLLSHSMPALVLSEKGSLSERTQLIFRTMLANILKENTPANGAKVCSAEKTLKHLAEKYYTANDSWPLVIRSMQREEDHLGLTPKDDCKLALKALGECIAYLNKCHLEEKVLSMARYNFYVPPDMQDNAVQQESINDAKKQKLQQRSHMVLDSITLRNLRITGDECSLLSTLDNCCTKFGKRLLHHWVCAPSCDLIIIEERQAAITDFLNNTAVLQEVRALMAPLPDFERNLAQIHLFGNKKVVTDHPDGRAILFEEKIYNKKKIQSFIRLLKGFELVTKIPLMFQEFDSPLIKRITQYAAEGGVFPDMSDQLKFFETAFDHETASKTGVIAPEIGVDSDYDEVEAKIKDISKALNEYLVEQERFFGCRLAYFGSDKKRFQLEVPEKNAGKAGKSYQLESQRKGNKAVRRYSTNETRGFLKRMQNAETERDTVLKDISRRIFEKFSQHYEIWKQCVECVSNLDVLSSLAEYARNQNVICVPKLQAASNDAVQKPFIDMEGGYHPCLPADKYIPNGIVLGTSAVAPLSILTGPNMGGKSTLMREVGLLVVMAQIGAHVPAESCKFSIVDRIFTRLGAQDDILSGHSTFLVELNETSLILKHATVNSLVLLDELGRGTATYDGMAIAASVVNFLGDLKCRTLFSTHYHNLVDFFHKDPRITLGHMACMVENEDIDDPTQETVTFLYKYTPGACPKSYGFNAAKLAGMPHPIIKRAYELSKQVEAVALRRKITAKIIAAAGGVKNMAEIKNLLIQLKACHV